MKRSTQEEKKKAPSKQKEKLGDLLAKTDLKEVDLENMKQWDLIKPVGQEYKF